MKEANRRATTGDAEMEDTLCDIIAMLKSMPLLDTSLVEGELLFDKENGLDMGHASAIGEEAVGGLRAWLDYEDDPDVQINTMELQVQSLEGEPGEEEGDKVQEFMDNLNQAAEGGNEALEIPKFVDAEYKARCRKAIVDVKEMLFEFQDIFPDAY